MENNRMPDTAKTLSEIYPIWKEDHAKISPPMFLDHSSSETIMSKGHICCSCHGSGWIWGEDLKVKCKKCKKCNGTGRLDVNITIEWKPANNNKD